MSTPLDGYQANPSGYYSTSTSEGSSVDIPGAPFLIAGFVIIVVGGIVLAWCCVFCYIRQITTSSSSSSAVAATVANNPSTPTSPTKDDRVDPESLASTPSFVYSSAAQMVKLDCAVCLNEFNDGEKGRLLPSCGHSFHAECIDVWLRSHSTCPLCRSPLESVVVELPV